MKMEIRVWNKFETRRVFWFCGATGTGKTRVGMHIVSREKSWVKLNGNLKDFMIGYDDEEGVLIDDIRAGSINFEQLLAITDGYSTIVNVKGDTECGALAWW